MLHFRYNEIKRFDYLFSSNLTQSLINEINDVCELIGRLKKLLPVKNTKIYLAWNYK